MAIQEITYLDGNKETATISQGHRIRAEMALSAMGREVAKNAVTWMNVAAFFAVVKPKKFNFDEFLTWSDTIENIEMVEEQVNPTQADLVLDPQ